MISDAAKRPSEDDATEVPSSSEENASEESMSDALEEENQKSEDKIEYHEYLSIYY